MPLIKLAYASN